jgi:hypothetical protein
MAQVVAAMARTGGLRRDLTVEEASGRLAVLIDPEIYRLTVVDGGWTPHQHRAWLEELAVASLLNPEAA